MGVAEDRLRVRFGLLDANSDGVLEQRDFETLVERVIAASGAGERSPEAVAARTAALGYWQGLREHADSDNDGVVDIDEFTAVVHDQEAFDRYVRPYAEATAALADGDNDGQVQRDRYLAIVKASGFPSEAVETVFAGFDAEGSERLTRSGWIDIVEGFYTRRGAHFTDRLSGPDPGSPHGADR
ncbi:EF-hand domain-containing protein [Streptomyces sp. NPDC127068]|uniref:EF-hand domain-containing protein n=1 Tax=Streptomyces sp. NPDC127068 TaxID=3347127 RepID=UPI0036664C73